MTDSEPAIECRSLSFSWGDKKVLESVTFALPPGSRCVLVGANGAGKSTLLRILGGRHMHDDSAAFVLGRNAFRDTGYLNNRRQYLDPNWGLRTVAFAGCGVAYQADIPIKEMMQKLQEEFPERRDELLELLEIDPDWRMHKLSDGQRRRVQLFLALIRPFQVLLLDEVTAVLDVLCRQRLLAYLRRECDERKCTMVYATHVFDGLDDWSTHMLWLRKYPTAGTVGFFGDSSTALAAGAAADATATAQSAPNPAPTARQPMLKAVETWFLGERAEMLERKAQAVPTDTDTGSDGGAAPMEEEAGANAIEERSRLQKADYGAGGFASGRMLGTVTRDGGGFDSGRMYNYW